MKKKVKIQQKIISLLVLITFTLQSFVGFASTTADSSADAAHKPTVKEVNNVTVVDIAAPNSKGLSHNLYTDFNVNNNGLILNNALQMTDTVLAGKLQANGNLSGAPARLILNEVTGTGRTNLNGVLEVAGSKASVIIANPNGITGDNFGFINADRISLVTGRPNIDANGNLDSFHVNSGEVVVEGKGIREENPATKLDIMTRAAKVNAAIWADELNVITGNNKIDYQTLKTEAVAEDPTKKPAVALDVGAVGGMYAGKIMLVGTEKGLGVSLNGEISAKNSLTLSNDGKITINGNIHAKEDVKITASDTIHNNGQITSNQNVDISAKNMVSSGFITAGEEEDDDDDGNGNATKEPVLANLTVNATENITISGNLSASKDVILSGKKVHYEASKVAAQKITANQSEPDTPSVDPGKPDNPGKEDPKDPTPKDPVNIVVNPKAPELPQLPDISSMPVATTKAVEKEQNLPVTADQSTQGQYKPIVDKTASGVDLIQIATPSASGISRNLYTDFNVNTRGLILNNATKYASTKLGGYIDYNYRLGGISARTILNEVTSANPSKLNGFIEVAGQKANVIIANPNGINVNGFGYINAGNATLSTGTISNWQNGSVEFYPTIHSNVLIQGDGLNAASTNSLKIITNNFSNTASELWANQLILSANGNITNTGKIVMTDSTNITGKSLSNSDGAVIYSTGNLDINVTGDIANQASRISTEGRGNIAGRKVINDDHAAITTGKDFTLTATDEISNRTSAIKSDGNTTITGKSFDNKETALLYSGGNLDLSVNGDIDNQTSTISANGKTAFTGNAVKNTDNAFIHSGNDLRIAVANEVNNQKSTIKSDGRTAISSKTLVNQDSAYLSSKKSLTVNAEDSIVNQGSALKSSADTHITTQKLENQEGSVLYSENALTVNAENNMKNQASAIKTNADLTVKTKDITNQETALISSGGNTELEVEKDITNQKSAIKSKGNTKITSKNFVNDQASFSSTGNLALKVADTIQNINSDIIVDGNTDLSAKNVKNEKNSAIFVKGNLSLAIADKFTNQKSVLAANGTAQLSAVDINNLDDSMIYSTGDMAVTAQNNILNQSSSIESQGNINIKANKLTNEKTIFETYWDIKNQNISYGISPIDGHYQATRNFAREIKTGTIKQETATAQILADKDISIEADVVNHYSTIAAGHDLTIKAPSLENFGYQSTIITTDVGNDYHSWKYKKHRRFHRHCHMVYGTTVIPYYNQTIVDDETARPGILSAVNKVTVNAGTIDNKTFDAGKNIIQTKDRPAVTANVLNQLTEKNKGTSQVNTQINTASDSGFKLGSLNINTKIYTVNTNPTAKYLVETNPKFADYHNFLSSDYLLERIKSDPEKVMKRLGDGYYEQKLVTEQITNLTGRRFLSNYTSELEQYKALMENAATFAQKYNLTVGVALTKEQMALLTSDIVWLVKKEINGETVLVPEVYVAMLKSGDLTNSGAIISGTDVELIASDDLRNVGTIKGDKKVTINAQNITNENGRIAGEDINLTAKETVANNSATITGNNITITADNIINKTNTQTENYRELQQTKALDTASIEAKNNLTLTAENSIKNQGANLSAGRELVLTAKKDIDIESISKERHVAVSHAKSSASQDSKANIGSNIAGQNITINSGDNVTVKGSTVAADDNVKITAQNNVSIIAEKDSTQSDVSVGNRGGYYFNRQKDSDETVVGSKIAAGKALDIQSGKDITIKGSSVNSEKGKVTLAAKENVNINAESEHHESLHEEERQKTGFLSTTKTKIYDHQSVDAVYGSNLSGSEIVVNSGKNATVKGSTVIADKDVNITATENINIESDQQKSQSQYEKTVKKSGLFSGGGLGITIGTQKQRDQLANQNTEQIGSTVGSLQGKVDVKAGKDVDIKASDIVAKDDINITGENVKIESADNTYNSEEKHEFKQSGLTVALKSQTIDTVNKVYEPLKRASEVSDDRLKALYAYKAGKEVHDATKAKEPNKSTTEQTSKQNGVGKDQTTTPNTTASDPKASNTQGTGKETPKAKESQFSLSVSLGTTKSESQSNSQTTVAQGSSIKSDGNINIKATEHDIEVKGSEVEGKNVELKAKENIEITAGKNENKINSQSKNSSASIGVNINLGTGNVGGFNVGGSKQTGEIKENGTTYNKSTITAKEKLTTESGKDTNIIGSKVTGETVKVNVGENLNIESLQDKESYDEKNKSAGVTIGVGSISASASKGKINSNYESVTEQAGIYAGKGGFDVQVGKNTDLKGAVIASDATPDKNKISTDTLTYSDIENKAEYKASSSGVSIDTSKDAKYNEKGVTPNIGVTAKGDSDSTTKSAVSEGTIEVRSNPHQDLSGLSRDTTNSLNALGKIFDKKTVQEKQELAALFGEIAFEEVHKISEKNGWKDGSPEKVALHAVVGGIMSQLTGSGFKSGAMGAGVNELVQKELKKQFKDQPDVWQWASYVIGAAAAKAAGGDAQAGGSASASGTKNNSQGYGYPTEFLGYGYPKIDPSTAISTIMVAGVAYNIKKAMDGTVYLFNEAGKAVATLADDGKTWITNVFNPSIPNSYSPTYQVNPEYLTKFGLGNYDFPYTTNSQAGPEIVIDSGWKAPVFEYTPIPFEYKWSPLFNKDNQIRLEPSYNQTGNVVTNSSNISFEIGKSTGGQISETAVNIPDKTIPGTDAKEQGNSSTALPNSAPINNTGTTMVPGNQNGSNPIPGIPLTDDNNKPKVYDNPANNPTTGTGVITASTEGSNKAIYKPSPKHDPKSGWGSPNPIPNEKIGQELLDNAYTSSKNKQKYNIYEDKLIKFQPDGDGWHPYEVKNPAKEVPADVLRQMLDNGLITKVQYKKFITNK